MEFQLAANNSSGSIVNVSGSLVNQLFSGSSLQEIPLGVCDIYSISKILKSHNIPEDKSIEIIKTIGVGGLYDVGIKAMYDLATQDEPTKSDSRFKLKAAKDVFQERQKKNFLIEGLVKEKSVNLWFGKYGHKKTFVALSAGVSVACGREWLGLKTAQSNVLYINEDSDDDTLMDRLEAAIKGESLENDIPFYFMSLSGFNFLSNDDDIDHLIFYINETNAKLVIIDALDDIMAGFDENSVKDSQPLFLLLRNLCDKTGVAIIILHHSNKKGGIRGSTAIPGGADSSIKIESENGSKYIKITTDKIRHSKDFNRNAIITYIGNETDPNLLEKFYIVEGEDTPFEDKDINIKQKTILEYMKIHNYDLAVTEFLQDYADEKEKQSFRNAIYDLRDKKIIEKNEEKSKHNYTVFSIV